MKKLYINLSVIALVLGCVFALTIKADNITLEKGGAHESGTDQPPAMATHKDNGINTPMVFNVVPYVSATNKVITSSTWFVTSAKAVETYILNSGTQNAYIKLGGTLATTSDLNYILNSGTAVNSAGGNVSLPLFSGTYGITFANSTGAGAIITTKLRP